MGDSTARGIAPDGGEHGPIRIARRTVDDMLEAMLEEVLSSGERTMQGHEDAIHCRAIVLATRIHERTSVAGVDPAPMMDVVEAVTDAALGMVRTDDPAERESLYSALVSSVVDPRFDDA